MNISRNKLHGFITSYLSDTQDYGTEKEVFLAEATLNPFKNLITESKKTGRAIIKEMKASKLSDPGTIEDFFLYIENV